ncbi:FkbM family methyltransferase [Candidatus Falkowbacteria bacterium]|nr:FkbM family methyltransferase [Candidatus Falkowbacteria bacterium]
MKEEKTVFNNKELILTLRSQADKSVFEEIFKLGEYKAAEEKIKDAKNCVIDAGAQAGFFGLYARALNPDVKIIAIEPDEENLAAMEKNFSQNNIKDIEIISSALAGTRSVRDFFVSADFHDHSLNKNLVKKIARKVKVQGLTLGDILKKYNIEKIDLLKLDIEGTEYEVFKSLSQDDWEKINSIVLEYHDFLNFNHEALENILKQNNFIVKITKSKFADNLGFIFASK